MTPARADAEVAFAAMGSEIRVVVGAPPAALTGARRWIEDFDARLSRFRPGSELSRLNADPRPVVPASALLRAAVRAAVWAAQRSDGLVDPTLVDALVRAGYGASRAGERPASLRAALAVAPPRRPARPRSPAAWARFVVDDAARTVARPPGVLLDTGGTGKGLAADALVRRLRVHGRAAVDCGGDIRVAGGGSGRAPFRVEVAHPLEGGCAAVVALRDGGIATSGIDVQVWRRPDGGYAHHLIDPATGQPAWTGLVGATALAPTALEAETLAKAALLRGPAGGRRLLASGGGVLFHEDGGVERLGALARPAPLRVRACDLAGAR